MKFFFLMHHEYMYISIIFERYYTEICKFQNMYCEKNIYLVFIKSGNKRLKFRNG